MTSSPSETANGETEAAEADADAAVEAATPEPHPLQEFADHVAATVGGEGAVVFDTVKVEVDSGDWVSALTTARDEMGLIFFSWLSATDWSSEVQVGDPYPEAVEDRIEVLATVGDISEGRRVTFSTTLGKDSPSISSLVGVYAGANWHEREAHEMFGIDFEGHPNLAHLYLPDAFVGNPLRKSFPLLTREVKPWPGTVDVEAMPGGGDEEESADGPSEENPEA
ncbi:MAG TPA: NADH-quinone oxidoreductase subunit C [Acidimicrobiia bacterium]|nr:NADH-quinone oxidoreductase subunit C [Acidimicrobiia bacterium]